MGSSKGQLSMPEPGCGNQEQADDCWTDRWPVHVLPLSPLGACASIFVAGGWQLERAGVAVADKDEHALFARLACTVIYACSSRVAVAASSDVDGKCV